MYLGANDQSLPQGPLKYRQYLMAQCSEVVIDFHETWYGRYTVRGHLTPYNVIT
jgi:hypothetical protein